MAVSPMTAVTLSVEEASQVSELEAWVDVELSRFFLGSMFKFELGSIDPKIAYSLLCAYMMKGWLCNLEKDEEGYYLQLSFLHPFPKTELVEIS